MPDPVQGQNQGGQGQPNGRGSSGNQPFSFSNLFRPRSQQPSNLGGGQAQQGQQGNNQQSNVQGQLPNSGQQLDAQGQPIKKEPQGVELFKDLFKMPEGSGDDKPPEFKLDPNVIKQVSDKLDFSSIIPPDFYEKLEAKDPSAMKDLFNNFGRMLYTTQLDHHTVLTNKFIESRLGHDRKGLDKAIQSRLSKNSLNEMVADSPEAQEHVQFIGERLSSRYPDKAPDEIAKMTQQYFTDMAKMLNKDQKGSSGNQQDRGGQADRQVDWDKELGF